MLKTYACKLFAILITLCILIFACVDIDQDTTEQYIDHHPEYVDYDDSISIQSDRSNRWPTARKNYIEKHPVCEACGTSRDLNVHHIIPFNIDPSKELDPTNMITLCRIHHFSIGHYCGQGKSNWGLCSNPNVRKDAMKIRKYISK